MSKGKERGSQRDPDPHRDRENENSKKSKLDEENRAHKNPYVKTPLRAVRENPRRATMSGTIRSCSRFEKLVAGFL